MRGSHTPESNQTFLIDDVLALADEEIQAGILPLVTAMREGHYTTFVDLPLTAENVYDIPERAAACGVVKLVIVDGNAFYPCVRADISDLVTPNQSTMPGISYYLRGTQIVVLGAPASGSLRVFYQRWPNKLVNPAAAARVASFDAAARTITVSALPTTFTTATPVDFIQDQPGFDWLEIDKTPTNIAVTTLTFASLPSRLAVGDWISLAGTSPVPQFPQNFRAVLVQRLACRIYQLQGYMGKLPAARADLMEKTKAAVSLATPREIQEPKRLSAWNSIGRGLRRRF